MRDDFAAPMGAQVPTDFDEPLVTYEQIDALPPLLRRLLTIDGVSWSGPERTFESRCLRCPTYVAASWRFQTETGANYACDRHAMAASRAAWPKRMAVPKRSHHRRNRKRR